MTFEIFSKRLSEVRTRAELDALRTEIVKAEIADFQRMALLDGVKEAWGRLKIPVMGATARPVLKDNGGGEPVQDTLPLDRQS